VAAHRCGAGRDTINPYQALRIVFQDLLHRIIVAQLALYLPGYFVVSCGDHLQQNQTNNLHKHRNLAELVLGNKSRITMTKI
jgi:hypothetical protein